MKRQTIEFFKYLTRTKRYGTAFIIVTFLLSIAMILQSFSYRFAVSKFLSIVSSMLFMASSVYTIYYHFKEFKR